MTTTFSVTGGSVTISRYLSAGIGSFTVTRNDVVFDLDGDATSFGSYAPNYIGLRDVLLDLKLTFQNINFYPVIRFFDEAFENVSQGDALYLRNSDGKVGKAIANDTVEKALVVGFAQTTKLAGEQVGVLVIGRLASSGLAPGDSYYLSDTTPGEITTVPPTTVDYFVTRLGVATSNSEFNIQLEPPVQLK